MFTDATYRQWTSAFCEGSYFEGGWNTGDRIRFLSPSGRGMLSVIAESRPGEFLSIKHIGMIVKGIEDTTSEQVRAWTPAFENYTLTTSGADTEVKVAMDLPPEHEQYMLDTWPKALAKLKQLCEGASAS